MARKKSVISKYISSIKYTTIKDVDNEKILEWSKLRSSNEIRKETQLFTVEGIRAVEWFLEYSEFPIVNLIVSREEINRRTADMQKRITELIEKIVSKNISVIEVNREVYRKLSDVNKPKGILIIAKHNISSIEKLVGKVKENNGIAIVTVGINDPGNMGTIIRSGIAFGATGLFALEGSVDPYNPKVLRASTGHFLPSIRSEEFSKFKSSCIKEKIPIIALDSSQSNIDNISNIEDLSKYKNEPVAICIGSEGKGFPPHIKKYFDYTIQIPMSNKTESLNAGVAASLALWYLKR